MRLLCILFFCSLFFQFASAQQYVATKLFDMAATADVIGYGIIEKVDDHYFYVRLVNEKLKQLKVRKYVSRTDAYRWDKYASGQRVFVFLKRLNGEYYIMSPGGEGELAIVKDSIVLDMKCLTPKINLSLAGPGGITPAYRAKQSFMVGNKKVFGLRFSVHYFYRSVMNFRDCYQIIQKKQGAVASTSCFNFFERYTKSKSDAMKRKSLLMKLMYNDMESAQILNCKQG